MNDEGPQLETLLHRLAECPTEFCQTCMDDTVSPVDGSMQLLAIVCDHLRDMQPEVDVTSFSSRLLAESAFHRGLLAVTAWLLNDAWFTSRAELMKSMQQLFCGERLKRLASMLDPRQFVEDPDRREELVRTCLDELGLRPAGETQLQASDRLTTLDSVERVRILEKTLAAERRAREIREAMAKTKAQESASRYGE